MLPVVFGVAFTIELFLRADVDIPRALPIALVAAGAAGFRRSQPVASYVVTLAALVGLSRVVPNIDENSTMFIVLFLWCAFSLGAHARGREAVLGAFLVVAEIVLFVMNDGDPFAYGDIAFGTFLVGGPWAAGVAIRLRRDREDELKERNRLIREEQEENTRRAVAEERSTIARELHDVVAHAISVTVLQSRGARRQLENDEAAVRRALDAIEHTNTQALGDMRRLLAILRDTEGDSAPSPQPSLVRLDELVADVTESGLPVEVETHGEGAGVPPGVDLSAYRIVQEALTNVLKHAGPAVATVRLDYGADDLTLTVSDTGNGVVERTDGARGHGLIGIRERVAVVGGEVEAGPGETGGFVVRARLPYSLES